MKPERLAAFIDMKRQFQVGGNLADGDATATVPRFRRRSVGRFQMQRAHEPQRVSSARICTLSRHRVTRSPFDRPARSPDVPPPRRERQQSAPIPDRLRLPVLNRERARTARLSPEPNARAGRQWSARKIPSRPRSRVFGSACKISLAPRDKPVRIGCRAHNLLLVLMSAFRQGFVNGNRLNATFDSDRVNFAPCESRPSDSHGHFGGKNRSPEEFICTFEPRGDIHRIPDHGVVETPR